MSDHLLDDTLLAALAKARPARDAVNQSAEATRGALLLARIVTAQESVHIGPTARFDRRPRVGVWTRVAGAEPDTRPRHRSWPRWAAASVAVSLVAAGATVGLTRVGSAPDSRRPGTVLTAAEVNQMSSASKASLGSSGKAHGTVSEGGPTHTIDVTFSGQNYNVTAGWPGMTVTFRVVDGILYWEQTGSSGWTRYIGSPPSWWYDANSVPDPRTFLGALSPAARYQVVGAEGHGGAELTHLRALDPGRVPLLALFGEAGGGPPGSRVTALDVWVDSSNVVDRIDLSEGAGRPPYSAAATTTISVTFSDAGAPESITAPSSASAEPGPWLTAPHPG